MKISYQELGYEDLMKDTEKLLVLNPPSPKKERERGSLMDLELGSLILPAVAYATFTSN